MVKLLKTEFLRKIQSSQVRNRVESKKNQSSRVEKKCQFEPGQQFMLKSRLNSKQALGAGAADFFRCRCDLGAGVCKKSARTKPLNQRSIIFSAPTIFDKVDIFEELEPKTLGKHFKRL